MSPTVANGKVCYLEIPAVDVERSADFYRDLSGGRSGSWVTGRPPMSEVGLLVYVMVDSVADTVDKVTAAGGQIIQPIGGDAPEITARFRDPGGT
jgi:uncharacterized protein